LFFSAPHGSASGREGLDALATSALTEDIGVFFLGTACFSFWRDNSLRPFWRDYIATFKVLPLYDIETFYVCADSLAARGLNEKTPFVLDVTSCLLRHCANNFPTTTPF
jgi:tRNA 2-thiouridine synthesizing protein C